MHKVMINGYEDAGKLSMFYGLERTTFETGETVTFSVHTATDTSYSVTSAQVSVNCEGHKAGGIVEYSFIMPDADAEITVSSRSCMMNPNMYGMPLSGMMDLMGKGMNMNSLVNTDTATDADSFDWEGKPKFCSECGASTKNSNKFCRECGTPLLPIE